MTSLGGKPNLAVHLDRLSNEGVLFTHLFANSFRTGPWPGIDSGRLSGTAHHEPDEVSAQDTESSLDSRQSQEGRLRITVLLRR